MVRLLGGRAYSLLEELKRQVCACNSQGQQVLVLVPEQFTLEAERQLLDYTNLPGFFNVQVASPTRLAKRVLDEMSSYTLQTLDQFGLQMAMAQAVTRAKSRLAYYQHGADKPGFIQKLCSLIADFKQSQAHLVPEELLALVHDKELIMNPDKLNDIILIWQEYEKILAGRFCDGQDRQQLVADRLSALRLYEGWQVFAYGFDTITGSLGQVLLALASQARQVTVMLTCLEKPDIYLAIRKSMATFCKRCNAVGISADVSYLPDTASLCKPPIEYLQKHLFMPGSAAYQGEDDPREAIRMVSAASPYLEVRYMAEMILQKNRAGLPFDRMAVVAGHLAGYAPLISAIFGQSGIPFYLEEGLPVSAHPLCRFLIAALRAAGGNYKDMTVLLKSGFAPVTTEQAFRLENYCVAFGIKGSKWARPFTIGQETEEMEALRLQVMSPVLKLGDELKVAQTAPESLRAIFAMLEDCRAYETLQQEEEKLLAAGMNGAADRNRQVWKFLMNLLDQMALLFGDDPIPPKSVADWLLNGISTAVLGTLPPKSGQVTVGELGHTLTRSADTVFLIGLQADILQKDTQSLLTDDERMNAEELLGSPIGLTDDLRGGLARADFVRAVALAENKLYLMWPQADLSGTSLSPLSVLKNGVLILFPTLEKATENILRVTELPTPLSAATALSDVGIRLRAAAKEEMKLLEDWCTVVKGLTDSPETRHDMGVLWEDLYRQSEIHLSPATAGQLFDQQTASVSRLETYARCPYMFFVKYGLRPKDRPEWKVTNREEGNFYHAVLCSFASLAAKEPDFPNIGPKRLEELFTAASAEPLNHDELRPMADSPRALAGREWMLRNARRAAWLYIRHAQSATFKTVAEEQVFGRNGLPPIILELKDGSKVSVEGKIDRIDVWDNDADGKAYVRVIDYKSSDYGIEATKVWLGTQLQLLLYLSVAAGENGIAGKNGKAAGAFYFHVDDPLVDGGKLKSAVEDALQKELRLKGIYLSDDTVITALGKETIVAGKDSAISEPQMQSLLCYARSKATEVAEGIHAGAISVEPREWKDDNPCTHCEFASLCQVEKRGRKQRFPSIKLADLLEKLENKTE